MPIILLATATVLAALVGDAVAETIADGGRRIVALGGSLSLEVGVTETLTALTIAAAVAGFVWAIAIASLRGRRLERRMAEELDERWDAQVRHNAGVEGRNKLLEYRVGELQTKLEEITDRRDALVEEVRAVRKRVSELQNVAHEQREVIIRLTSEEVADELLIVPEPVPEMTPEGARGPDDEDEALDVGGGPGSERDDEPATSGSEAVERRVALADELRRMGF